MDPNRLDSWKSIAEYLGYSQRTVMRWQIERNLPVHRFPGGARGSVFAFVSEIEDWLSSRIEGGAESVPSASHRSQPVGMGKRAHHLWETRSEENLGDILKFYRLGIQESPDNAASYAGLACALLASSARSGIQGSIAILQAKAAVDKALTFEPDLPEALCAQAWIDFWRFRDFGAAARRLDAVLEKRPGCSFALTGQAFLYAVSGDSARSMALTGALLHRLSFSPYSALVACSIYFLHGEFKKALHIASQAEATRIAGPVIRTYEALSLVEIGEHKRALQCLLQFAAAHPEDAILVGSLGYAYGRSGEFESSLAIYRQLQRLFEQQIPSCAYPLAMTATALKREEEAIQWLEQSIAEECFNSLTLEIDPVFASLRGNPRFQRLVEQSKMPLSPDLSEHIFPEPPEFMNSKAGSENGTSVLKQNAG